MTTRRRRDLKSRGVKIDGITAENDAFSRTLLRAAKSAPIDVQIAVLRETVKWAAVRAKINPENEDDTTGGAWDVYRKESESGGGTAVRKPAPNIRVVASAEPDDDEEEDEEPDEG
jgi:hypothetical protein